MSTKDSDPESGERAGDQPQAAGEPDAAEPAYRLSPALIATLVAIPVMVIIAFIVFAVIKSNEVSATPVDSYAASDEDTDRCPQLIGELPETFGDYADKTVDGNTVRWTTEGSTEPLVFRCGVARPEDLAPTSALQVIHPTQWFITDTEEARGQAYVLVDRRPYVAVWVPAGAGNAPLTDISALVAELPPAPLDFGGN
ncbi:DUF3515 domain-containing protein [Gordonia caeni]|uniref:DUF3515 domain-containing protein n=1 Tax=Gordonia caeni TaxID=1007097 RepID=A0ABP7NYZ3_9ACTN